MKKTTSRSKGTPSALQAAPSVPTNTAATHKPAARPQSPSATPVWSRYVDSRLKQFCLR